LHKPVSEYLRQNILGLVAIFIALGGVSWAAQNLPANSVTSASLKNGAVKGPDIAANAVTGPKVAPDSLTGADVNEASLSIPPSSPVGSAGGDLTGTYPNPLLAAGSVGADEVAADSLAGADILESGLDFTVLQQRVTGACAAGSAVAAIGQTGAVGCNAFPTTLPPSGPAGGDLNGSTYPNPTITTNAVDNGDIQDVARTVSLPLGSFVNCDATNFGLIDFTSGADSAPDFETLADGQLTLNWDVSGAPNNDLDPVCTTVSMPTDSATSQPQVRLVAVAGANANNDWQVRILREGPLGPENTSPVGAVGGVNCDAAIAPGNIYGCVFTTQTASLPIGSAVIVSINRSGGFDPMRLYGAELLYPAIQ
jgi:hypothetical protein